MYILFHYFIRPVYDAAKLLDVTVAKPYKLLSGDLAPSAATAIHKDERILIGELPRGARGYLVLRNKHRAPYMTLRKLLLGAGIDKYIFLMGIHYFLCLRRGYHFIA